MATKKQLMDRELVNITSNDLIKEVRDTIGAGDQVVPTEIDNLITPAILVNPSDLPVNVTPTDPTPVSNSEVAGKEILETSMFPGDSISTVRDAITASITSGSSTTHTVHTVNSGKVFYLTDMHIAPPSDTRGDLRDNGVSKTGALGIPFTDQADGGTTLHFSCPIKFATNVQVELQAASTLEVVINGWEQDA